MAPPPVLALRDVFVTFGGAPLFTGVTVAAAPGEKICLVGRNGSGKSTLLKVLAGTVLPESGEVFRQPGVRIGCLEQDPKLSGATVLDYVLDGLPESERDQAFRAESVLLDVKLDPARDPSTLSGGEARRAALARVLVSNPDALLLDEPTNHLDLPTVLWLEDWLAAYTGALVVISHDRAFLTKVSKQTLWLWDGKAKRSERGFAHFTAWADEEEAAEEAELARMDKKLAAELHWLARGVTARRKRNMGRLRALNDLRGQRAARSKGPRSVQFDVETGTSSGALVVEAKGIGKAFGDTVICTDFTTRIMRGDRVGLIGANGAGKTSLLRLLTGQLAPDQGEVRLGTNLEAAYYDQRREALDYDATIWDTLTDKAGDSVHVRGQVRHVASYARDFLFTDAQLRSPVKALSGGERNRLLLAKLLAKPANLLILDEPTNDLDMDTLDLLEEMLADFEGTLILVSHDRDFLDRVVTSVIAVEGNGRVEEYPGGYSDYARQRPKDPTPERASARPSVPEAKAPRAITKLSYKENRELEELPARIEALLGEIEGLEGKLADPAFYGTDPARYAAAAARLETARHELAAGEERWLELEMKRESLGKR